MLKGRSLTNRCCMCRSDGSRWTTFSFIVLLHTPYGFLCLRLYSLGHARLGGKIVILLASMAWESYFKYLELDSKLFDVDCLVGMKSPFL